MPERIIPKKRFSQNFINNSELLSKIYELIKYNSTNIEKIIEIGPGSGVLTTEILKLKKELTAVEIDIELYSFLLKKFEDFKNFNLINKDIIDFFDQDFQKIFNSEKILIVGNLPYNIGTKIVLKLTSEDLISNLECCIFMLQREVVERIVAKDNSKDFGRLSVIIQSQFDVKSLIDLNGNDFFPKVKVESSVFIMKPKKNRLSDEKLQKLSILTKILFSTRRKMISSIVRNNEKILEDNKIIIDKKYFSKRPEQISVSEYISML